MKTLNRKICWSMLGLGLLGYASGCAVVHIELDPCELEQEAAKNRCELDVDGVLQASALELISRERIREQLLLICCDQSEVPFVSNRVSENGVCMIEEFASNNPQCQVPGGAGDQTPPAAGGGGETPAAGGSETPPADGGGGTPPAGGGSGTPPAAPVCNPNPDEFKAEVLDGLSLDPQTDLPKCAGLDAQECFRNTPPTQGEVLDWLVVDGMTSPCITRFGNDYCTLLDRFCSENIDSIPLSRD